MTLSPHKPSQRSVSCRIECAILSIEGRKVLTVKRREFITVLGGAGLLSSSRKAWPQQYPVIGYLSTLSEAQVVGSLNAFRRGLSETGFTEGRNVAVEYRYAEGQYERLPGLAAELVARPVSLILAQAPPAAMAAKAATASIPIVFVVGLDPIAAGLVLNLNNPGGNATGMTLISHVLGPKRLELLRDILPKASSIAMLVNPLSPDTLAEVLSVQGAAQALRADLTMFTARTQKDIQPAFNAIAQKRVDGLLIGTDPFLLDQRAEIVAQAKRLSLPTIYPFREYAAEGGLISYGTNISSSYHEAGVYAGRILKGAAPSDLPVMQPTTFQLVINLPAAKALGLTVPPTLLARADEVIE
jgi:putative tryptophan/tyrosine transport system substrate-binding protein